MRIFKSLKQGLLYRTYPEGNKFYLVSTLLSFFSFSTGTADIIPEIDGWKFLETVFDQGEMFDIGMPKSRGEMLVTGSFFAREGKPLPVGRVKIKIATIEKELAVFGDRIWQKSDSALWSISRPEPIGSIPVSYKFSFGGLGFPKNPLGRGRVSSLDKVGGRKQYLPNLEYPDHLISAPSDSRDPAGFGPLDLMWEQRFSKTGTYDEKWLHSSFPGHAVDMDKLFYNTAPEDQQIVGFFKGDECFQIENMHPAKSVIKANLPRIRGRCFVNQRVDDETIFQEVKTNLDTVWLFPAEEIGVLLFRGVHEVYDPDAEDVLQQLIAYEAMEDNKRPLSHYKTSLNQRLNKDISQYHMFNEAPLIPEGAKSGFVELLEHGGDKGAKKDSILAANLKVRSDRVKEEAKKNLESLGIDPESYFREESGDVPELDLENVEHFIEQLEELKKKAELEKIQAEQTVAKRMASHGFDFYQLKKESETIGGRPDLSIEEKVTLLQETGLSDPEVEKKLYESQEKMDQTYREFGHHFPAAAVTSAEEAQQKRRLVILGIEKRSSFVGIDLTGADLSDLDLQGVDFSNSFMEGVDLTGSDLSKSNLSGSALMRSTLNGTKFDSAIMKATNFGHVICEKVRFSNADMSNSIFYEARIENSRIENCTLEEAEFSHAVISNSTIYGSIFNRSRFMESRFEEVSFRKAECKETIFLNVLWKDVDFTETNLTAAICVGVNGAGTVFQKANLTNLRTAGETSFAGCDFKNAILVEATLRDINCSEADFSGADISHADFGKCNLQDANLFSATAKGTQFVKANLTSANMTGINLCEGSLQKACLYETDLHVSNLYGVDFIEAKFRNTNITGANRKKAFLERWIKS